MKVALRNARLEDAPALTALVQSAYRRYVEPLGGPPRPMTDDYATVITHNTVTIADHDDQLAGVIVLGTDGEGFHIDNLAVHPSHQGTGIGRALLQHAEDEARKAGFDAICLYTHELMTENQAIYGRIGYVEYDRRRHGDFEMVYMRKRLT